ncbi:hypothetical protein Moror_13673 [Moniliophthora roreri MCA 2997]|uniref:Uncharacterized protein n=1 Tax=Moniliophthora roreri (strain MCA 2997) TaxID=1381753 RepID=V2X9I1_MONRO|nr:hypothetical protein Moror_13673 [Moniliophthora roreri MCA 2997]
MRIWGRAPGLSEAGLGCTVVVTRAMSSKTALFLTSPRKPRFWFNDEVQVTRGLSWRGTARIPRLSFFAKVNFTRLSFACFLPYRDDVAVVYDCSFVSFLDYVTPIMALGEPCLRGGCSIEVYLFNPYVSRLQHTEVGKNSRICCRGRARYLSLSSRCFLVSVTNLSLAQQAADWVFHYRCSGIGFSSSQRDSTILPE